MALPAILTSRWRASRPISWRGSSVLPRRPISRSTTRPTAPCRPLSS